MDQQKKFYFYFGLFGFIDEFQGKTNYLNFISENDYEFNYNYSILAEKFQIKKEPFGFPFVGFQDVFTSAFENISDFLWNNSIENGAIPFNSVKCGDIIFVKRDYIMDFFDYAHRKIKFPYILITHESDYSTGLPEHLEYLNDSKIIKWFAMNIIAKHPKLKPLPIGIVGEGNFKDIYQIAKHPIPYYNRTTLLYLNFALHTNEKRNEIQEYFQNTFDNNSNVLIVENRVEWKKYLKQIGNSQFVLSPPGNGLDCYRTWEALIMGAVPIVMESELIPLYENMPVMIVKNWKEVTEENLKKFQKEKLKNFSKDKIPWRPKIWMRYWINEIMSVKQNYIENFCNRF